MHRAVMAATTSPGIEPGWAGFRGIDRAVLLDRGASLLAVGASLLGPAEVLTAVSEAVAPHLALTAVVFFKRVAGQSRTLAWSAPGIPAARRLAAREHAWTRAAELVDHVALDGASTPRSLRSGETASVSVEDARLGIAVMLYVESRRTLDGHDRWLLQEIVHRMLGTPGAEEH